MRIVMLCGLALACLVLHHSSSQAADGDFFVSAGDLDIECGADSKSASHQFCLGYVASAADSILSLDDQSDADIICMPDKTSVSKLVAVFQAYFKKNLESFDDLAQDVVVTALLKAYRCSR